MILARPIQAGGVALAVAILVLPFSAAAATPKPSWSCIQRLCVGQSRELIDYRYGKDWREGLYRTITVPKGRTITVPKGKVTIYFYKEYVLDYVALDNVKDYGRVTGLASCDPNFELPDGVALGTKIPFGKTWNGYKRVALYEPGPRPGWRKFVRVGKAGLRVTLDIDRGRVTCVSIARKFS